MRGHVFHVTRIFVAAFYLETANAGIDQRTQVRTLVVVFHRQQMFVERDHAALAVVQGVRQAAFLRTRSAIGAAPGVCLADVAVAGESYAERAVNKKFKRYAGVHRCTHLCNLL